MQQQQKQGEFRPSNFQARYDSCKLDKHHMWQLTGGKTSRTGIHRHHSIKLAAYLCCDDVAVHLLLVSKHQLVVRSCNLQRGCQSILLSQGSCSTARRDKLRAEVNSNPKQW
jgi:hypothetical protein